MLESTLFFGLIYKVLGFKFNEFESYLDKKLILGFIKSSLFLEKISFLLVIYKNRVLRLCDNQRDLH